jgi:DNA-binding beta-propeller fold protein YncE
VYVASTSRPVTGDLGVGGIATFARAVDGTLAFLEVEQQGVGAVDGLWGPRDVAVSPDGAHVYVASGGRPVDMPPLPGAVTTFAREIDGTLAFQSSIPESAFGGGSPRGIALSPDGATVEVVTFGVLSGAIGLTPGKLAVFARDPGSGALALAQRFDDGVDAVDGLAGALGVAVSPDGQNVYVAASEDPAGDPLRGAVAVFTQVPEPGLGAASAAALAALAALLQRSSSSQSRGRRNSL